MVSGFKACIVCDQSIEQKQLATHHALHIQVIFCYFETFSCFCVCFVCFAHHALHIQVICYFGNFFIMFCYLHCSFVVGTGVKSIKSFNWYFHLGTFRWVA